MSRLLLSASNTAPVLRVQKGRWGLRGEGQKELHTVLVNQDGTVFFLNKDEPTEMRDFEGFCAEALNRHGVKVTANSSVVYLSYPLPFFI